MPEQRLTPISYVVLGFIEVLGPSTPYDIKQAAEGSIGYFWTFAHTQFYGEPEKLTEAGLLVETKEETGRRRRIFSITREGRAALEEWLHEPTAERREIRDLGLLKLFFSEFATTADVEALQEAQLSTHREMVAELETLRDRFGDRKDLGYRPTTITSGLMIERAIVDFWATVVIDEKKRRQRRPIP